MQMEKPSTIRAQIAEFVKGIDSDVPSKASGALAVALRLLYDYGTSEHMVHEMVSSFYTSAKKPITAWELFEIVCGENLNKELVADGKCKKEDVESIPTQLKAIANIYSDSKITKGPNLFSSSRRGSVACSNPGFDDCDCAGCKYNRGELY